MASTTAHHALGLLLAIGPSACVIEDAASAVTEVKIIDDGESSTTSGSGEATTWATSGTVTTADEGTSSSSGSTGGLPEDPTATAGELPPVVIAFEVTPELMLSQGPIAVQVEAERADGVRMELDDGTVSELGMTMPGIFEGEIPALTGLWNGEHLAKLTPWRDDGQDEGASVAASYTLALPKPGSQGFWETGDLLGSGVVRAIDVLPDGRVVEFGQRWVGGVSRCYLRRRDKSGAWKPTDVQEVLPGVECAPLDMKIDAKGSIVVLASRTGNDGARWWLGEIDAWGATATNRGLGVQEEIALAVAVEPAGRIAVCGAVPTQDLDGRDAAAWIFKPGLAGEAWNFDYLPKPNFEPHLFVETGRDCVFAGDTLVMVGEAFGNHDEQQNLKRTRHFVHRFDLVSKADAWMVADGAYGAQSAATAVVVDYDGHLITAGYACGDTCSPLADLRVFDLEDGLLFQIPLGELPGKSFGPHDLAWSPAGYVVVALGGFKDEPDSFSVRAHDPFTIAPLWTFTRKDNQLFQMAFAVAVGTYGEVYAGGFGSNGYPAVAYIAG